MELFRNANFLFWGAGLFTLLVFLYFRLSLRKERIIASIFDPAVVPRVIPEEVFSVKRKRDLSMLAAFLLLLVAVAGPQWQREFSEVSEMNGNILIAVDTSLSMSAKDIKPTRLENAKVMIKFLANTLKSYRLALSAFQGKAYIQCPLTNDTDAVEYFIDTLRPNMLPFRGTNLSDTLVSSADYLSRYGGDRMLVIITDGEDHSEGLDNALALAKEANVRIFTVGIGSEEGDLLADDSGQGYKKDNMGHTVLSKLDENTLIKIAHQTQGQYVKYTNPEFVSDEIKKFADNLKMSKSKSAGGAGYKNHYQLPLVFALILILIEFMLMEEKNGRTGSSADGRIYPSLWGTGAGSYADGRISASGATGAGSYADGRKRFLGVLLLIALAAPGARAKSAGAMAADGNSSYKKKDYSKAYDYYKRAAEKDKNEKILFNAGNSLYRLEQYGEADKYFEGVKNEKIKSRALFNLGNSKYSQKDLNGAIENYKKAVLLDPKDKNAKHNLQVALTQKKEQEKQNDKKNDKKEDKKNKQQGGGDDEKKKQEEDKKSGDDRKDAREKEQEKKRAEQILNMLKEKESENQKNMQKQQDYSQENSNFTDKDW